MHTYVELLVAMGTGVVWVLRMVDFRLYYSQAYGFVVDIYNIEKISLAEPCSCYEQENWKLCPVSVYRIIN